MIILLGWWWFLSIPAVLFDSENSTVVFDRNHELLSAKIAPDGQYRFITARSIPDKFKTCILTFEDEGFMHHHGVSPKAIIRAAKQNIEAGSIQSGASTISMQTIRLSRKNPKRSYSEKALEILRALRLEFRFDKDEILSIYCNHAPMGGNVVGLEAAAWRYYEKKPEDLSWAESATLAVLPNAPSLIYPGRRNIRLQEKRNRLLDRLHDDGHFDEITLELSKEEPVPSAPRPLPQIAMHTLYRLQESQGRGAYETTLDAHLQKTSSEILHQHLLHLSGNEVQNAALLITDVETGEVLVYHGNASLDKTSGFVDVIQSERSTGSILKPLLYTSMLDEGEILAHTLMPDIPTDLGGYRPVNFHETYDGAVPASESLIRSLNVPAVLALKKHGNAKFLRELQELGFSFMNKTSDHYGLSLILGGAETNLWELNRCYGHLAHRLNHYTNTSSTYPRGEYRLSFSSKLEKDEGINYGLSAGAIYQCFDQLRHLARPRNETGWEHFGSSSQVAWKTGTSFGHRDAWAVGITSDYIVSVWVGNETGEGRPGLTGVSSAAPILFDVLDLLPVSEWFDIPYDDLKQTPTCSASGMLASMHCPELDTLLGCPKGMGSDVCKYHKKIFLDHTGQRRVHKGCMPDPQPMSWFVLPAVQAAYFKQWNPEYRHLPPWSEGCGDLEDENALALIYPSRKQKILIPRGLDGKQQRVVLKASHQNPSATLHWSLNGVYLGSTETFHIQEVAPVAGNYQLTITDEFGNQISEEIRFIEGG